MVYMFDASSGEIDTENPSNILMKTTATEIDLSNVDSKGLKNVTFVVTTINRFRQESIVVDRINFTY